MTELTILDHIENLKLKLLFEEPSQFGTGEYIHRGQIFPSFAAYAAWAKENPDKH